MNAFLPAGKFCITDNSGKLLYGETLDGASFPVKAEEDILGSVQGAGAKEIAELLNFLSQKEVEKKRIGAEVLTLYKEINLIFNFSERLASTIDAFSICRITLDEATRVINSKNGVVILLDHSTQQSAIVASAGNLFSEADKVPGPLSLSGILSGGQSEIITDGLLLTGMGINTKEINTLVYSALKVNDRILGSILLGCNDMMYTAAHLKLLTTLALQSSAAIESALLFEKNIRESREREEAMRLVYEATGKFVPYEFIGALGRSLITDVKLGDQVEKIVTVLFSDIREYTTLSEKMTPEENFRFVCSFNERMGPVIRRHNGFINQYLGDAIMAIFPGNAADALSAAVEMQKEVDELNAERRLKNELPIRIGVGMHTGPLIMGITGDADRMDATTISDTVNTASRLESLTKYYKANVILSDACIQQINKKENYHLRYLGQVQLKGKNESLHIHECFSGNAKEEIAKKQNTLATFNDGISHYLNSSFEIAVTAFETVTALHPEDQTAAFFLEATQKYLQAGNTQARPGIIEMASK